MKRTTIWNKGVQHFFKDFQVVDFLLKEFVWFVKEIFFTSNDVKKKVKIRNKAIEHGNVFE